MSENISHSNYSAKDIERYLLGKMSHEEMYAIEKAALDDSLLAEAIEGYEGMQQTNWDEALEELKGKLAVAEKAAIVDMGRFSFAKWWRVAAAVLLLISSVAIVYILIPNKPPAALADVKKPQSNEASDAENDTAVITSILPEKEDIAKPKQFAEVIESKATNKQPTQKIIATIETSKDGANDDFVYTPNVESFKKNLAQKKEADYPSKPTEVYEGVAGSNPANADLNANSIVEKEQSSLNQSQNQANNQAVSTTPNNTYLNGKVVGVDNNPLPYAQIKTDVNKAPVYADANGNFKIPSADTTMEVVVNAAGFAAKKVTLQNAQSQQKIVLDETAIVLKEFTSSKNKTASKEAVMRKAQQKELEEQEDDEAEPINGWVDYNNYLLENKIHSNTNTDKQMHGIVEVFVKLSKDGAVTTVKVAKSLCAECDAEALRLVKQGPKWKIKNKKVNSAKVKVKF